MVQAIRFEGIVGGAKTGNDVCDMSKVFSVDVRLKLKTLLRSSGRLSPTSKFRVCKTDAKTSSFMEPHLFFVF